MPDGRPGVPRPLERSVLVEAGHRCAIPACRSIPVEIAHIIPWAQVREHSFDNLIALCPTCHARFDRGDIDRMSMRQYKENLAVLNGRYTDVERQLLMHFCSYAPGKGYPMLPRGMRWMVRNLLDDGLVEVSDECGNNGTKLHYGPEQFSHYLVLTAHGNEFIGRWLGAEPLL